MASLSSLAWGTTMCSTSKKDHDPNKQLSNLSTLKVNEVAFARSVSNTEKLRIADRENRQNIPTTMQLVDPYRQGMMIREEDIFYRQTIVIRSSEVGPDENMTIESIFSLLQETAMNQSWMTGQCAGGTGASHGMIRNNLTWVITRMHVHVDCYPIWGEVIDIDTWAGASGKNGLRREWLIKSHSTGHIYARAISKWVMMNQQTRRLLKMPEDVRATEVSPWFSEKRAFEDYTEEKIEKLDQNPKLVVSGLKARWCDLDTNHHVNNVIYARWMLEVIPDNFFKNHQLSDIIIEYKKECGSSDVIQSLCEPHECGNIETQSQHSSKCNGPNGLSVPMPITDGNGHLELFNPRSCSSYTHLLRTEGETKNVEIARGRTRWKTRE